MTDQLTKTISVPAWMVYFFSTLGSVAALTIGGVILQDRGQVHALGNEQRLLTQRVAMIEVKHADFNAQFNSINATLRTIEREVLSHRANHASP